MRKKRHLIATKSHAVSVEIIERKIYLIRGQKVMLDRDLAQLYGVKPIALRQQVKRNSERFPNDFTFKLSEGEAGELVSQNVIPSRRSLGGHLPLVFTEQGVAMLSSVLKSMHATLVNIAIMRAFVRLRELLSSHKDLIVKLEELERKYERHDVQIKGVFNALRKLLAASREPRRPPIGF